MELLSSSLPQKSENKFFQFVKLFFAMIGGFAAFGAFCYGSGTIADYLGNTYGTGAMLAFIFGLVALLTAIMVTWGPK